MLSAHGLGYRLPGGRELFSGLDLHVRRGEAVAIVAPSGTGKSTLLAVLGGLLPPTAGTVSSSSAGLATFAWIPQSLNALGARTVSSNASLLAMLDGTDRTIARERADEALERMDLQSMRNRRARSLSGGELQRMTVARALACTRPIIFADEPTSQLDRANARRVLGALFESAGLDNRAVIVVTHDHDSLPVWSRVLTLHGGGLREG